MGIRLCGHRDKNKVWVFTEDRKRDRAPYLPDIVKEIKGLPCESVILDWETVIWESGAPIPRHEMIKIVISKTPLRDIDIRCNVFDIVYYNGKSLINLPWKERQIYLKKVLPKDLKHLKRVEPCIVTNRREFDKCVERLSKAAGSEGVMCKSVEGKYNLSGRTGEWCLPADGYLYGNSSVIEAKKAKISRKVYDHNGKFASIKAIETSDFNGNLVRIKPSNLPEFSLTPEHRVLVIQNGRLWRKRKSYREDWWRMEKLRKTARRVRPSKIKSLDKDFRKNLKWVRAEDIRIEDYLLFPPLQPFPVNKDQNRSRSYDFFELCGWFVSEGYSDHPSRIRIAQSNKSENYRRIQKLIERLNLNYSIEPKRFTIKDPRLTKFLKYHFGSHSYTKKLPSWLLNSNLSKLKSFLKGYWAGDGSMTTGQCLTVSRELAWGLVLIFSRFGILPSWYIQNRKNKAMRINPSKLGRSRKIQEHILDIQGISKFLTTDAKMMEWNKFSPVFLHEFGWINLTEGSNKRKGMKFFILPIKSIKKIPYSGKIYHFETSRGTFATPVVVHNSKLKLAFELKTSVIGIYRKPFPFPKGQVPKSDLTGQEAISTFKRLQQKSKTYILRCAYRGKTGKLEAIYSDRKLTLGDLSLKWNASKKKWQGTEDPRIWQMARGFSPGKLGEYAYGNTYAKKLEPGPKIGDIVTVRPILVRKFKTDGRELFAWMFPNLREIDPTRTVPDTIDDMERIARESAARTPGKKTQMEIMEAIHQY